MAVDYAAPFIHPISYMLASESHKISRVLGVDKIEPNLFEAKEEKAGKQRFRWCYIESGEGGFINWSKATLDKLEKSSKFFEKINRESRITIKKVEDYVSRLFRQNLEKYSNKKLASVYLKLFNLVIDMNIWGHIVNLVDFSHNMLTNKILSFLEKTNRRKEL